jgi:hypothetical protein
MELFYGGGGASNPNFRFKVRTKIRDGMMEWCDDYPVTGQGYFQRYYIDWKDNGVYDSGYVTFQFEWEEPAIMFALKFGASNAN